MFKEFRNFAFKGSLIDMAVGIIIGGAFGTIIQSLVNDIIMPPIGLMLGNMDFKDLFIIMREGSQPGPFASLAQAKAAGAVTFNYGAFINNMIVFIIVAFSVFLLIKSITKLQKVKNGEPAPTAPSTKQCPYCMTTISINATRCPNCTSEISGK